MRSARKSRDGTVESTATRVPPRNPTGMTTAQSSAVMPKPCSSSGTICAMISTLKKVSIIACMSAFPGKAPLDRAAEHDHGNEQDEISGGAQGKRRRIAGERLRRRRLRQNLRHRDDGAERRPLGDGNG